MPRRKTRNPGADKSPLEKENRSGVSVKSNLRFCRFLLRCVISSSFVTSCEGTTVYFTISIFHCRLRQPQEDVDVNERLLKRMRHRHRRQRRLPRLQGEVRIAKVSASFMVDPFDSMVSRSGLVRVPAPNYRNFSKEGIISSSSHSCLLSLSHWLLASCHLSVPSGFLCCVSGKEIILSLPYLSLFNLLWPLWLLSGATVRFFHDWSPFLWVDGPDAALGKALIYNPESLKHYKHRTSIRLFYGATLVVSPRNMQHQLVYERKGWVEGWS